MTDDIRTLIDQHKAATVDAVLDQVEVKKDPTRLYLADARVAEVLAAEDTRLALQEKAIKERRSMLRKAMENLSEDKTGVSKEDGTPIYTITRVPVTRVNQAAVKENMPEDKFPGLYTTKEESRITVDVNFKATVESLPEPKAVTNG